MKYEELLRHENKLVRVTTHEGAAHEGLLEKRRPPEPDPYFVLRRVMPGPNTIDESWMESIKVRDVKSITPPRESITPRRALLDP